MAINETSPKSALKGPLAKLPLSLSAAIVTIAAWGLSCFLVYDISSISYFAPLEKASDFRFSDFYEQVADQRAVSELDGRVVVVSIDGCNRREIGRAISDVNFCLPEIIGLDVMFGPPRKGTDDSTLVHALCSTPRLILPIQVDDKSGAPTVRSYYDSVTGSEGRYAAINIEGSENSRTIVREFRSMFGTTPGFAAALAGNSNGPDRIRSISYASRRFRVIPADSVISCMDEIEGKIVLIGKVNDRADHHITPLNNFMPGVIIHAHSVATILYDDAPRQLPVAAQWLMAILLCYIVVFVNLRYDGFRSSLAVRLLQLLILFALVFAGTKIYICYRVDLNCGFAMVMVASGLIACDIVCGFLEPNHFYSRFMQIGWIKRLCKQTCNNSKENEKESDTKTITGSNADSSAG